MMRSRFFEKPLPPTSMGRDLHSTSRLFQRAAFTAETVDTPDASEDGAVDIADAQEVGHALHALHLNETFFRD